MTESVQTGSRLYWKGLSLWMVALALMVVPLSAQELLDLGAESTASCGAVLDEQDASLGTSDAVRPLAVEKRLIYPLAALGDGLLEITISVDGEAFATERMDLATARLPFTGAESKLPVEEEGAVAVRERVVEILSLRPDWVRRLHRFADQGRSIEIDFVYEGRSAELLSFEGLRTRSADLRAGRGVPVMVASEVAGELAEAEPVAIAAASNYLPDCASCTTNTPCDTECGWDPDKGGPVTCGEYGVCQPPTCACSTTSSEYWTGWYRYSFFPANTGQLRCYQAFGGGLRLHERFVQTDRRDRIRRKMVCPNCPSCSGCHIVEEVIAYETRTRTCWEQGVYPCQFGSKPCCSILCFSGSGTPCRSNC